MENITRRSALIAAAAVGLSATASAAEQPGDKSSGGDKSRQTRPLSLHIVLPDGQTVDLKAAELVIDFGGDSRLLVKPDGLAPGLDPSDQNPGQNGKPH